MSFLKTKVHACKILRDMLGGRLLTVTDSSEHIFACDAPEFHWGSFVVGLLSPIMLQVSALGPGSRSGVSTSFLQM